MREVHHLLLDALVQPGEQAGEAWRQWRRTADLDRLDSGSFGLLPVLAGRMDDWIANDPQRAILTGICRRGWSQEQIARKVASEAAEVLHAAGIDRVAWTGPLQWAHLYFPKGAVRAADLVDLLVEESAIPRAVAALSQAGWRMDGPLANWDTASSYFTPAIRLQFAAGGRLRLRWRELPNTDFALRRLPAPEVDWTCEIQDRHQISPEHALVGALYDEYSDGIEWRCYALLLCRRPDFDWDKVVRLMRWRLRGKARLEELCGEWDLDLPRSIAKRLRVTGGDRLATLPLRYYRQVKLGVRGRAT